LNSDQANKWLTLLANFGVVIGLALLIYELRLSQNLAETEASVRRLDQMQMTQVIMATDDVIVPLREKAIAEGVESLSLIEFRRLQAWEYAVRLRMRSQYIEYVNGFLDEETADIIVRDAARVVPYWESLGYEFGNTAFDQAVREAAGR
jgi:hypothetical protein